MELSLITHDECALARIVPPQTKHGDVGPAKGIYCFVIDVSGSMHTPAEVTTDDGDKISHGWSQLDIGKHSTNAFVSSLGADDYVSIVTYSDGARVHLGWTLCDGAGKEAAMSAIDAMRPERSTNLMAGLTTGFDQMGALPNDLPLEQYTVNLIVTTDGMPSAQARRRRRARRSTPARARPINPPCPPQRSGAQPAAVPVMHLSSAPSHTSSSPAAGPHLARQSRPSGSVTSSTLSCSSTSLTSSSTCPIPDPLDHSWCAFRIALNSVPFVFCS